MKLIYPLINSHFYMSELFIPVLVLENPKYFFDCLSEIKCQISGKEGRFVLSRNDKILPLNKHAELIDSFLNFEINKKILLTKLYSNISAHAVLHEQPEEVRAQVEEALAAIENGEQYSTVDGYIGAAAASVVEEGRPSLRGWGFPAKPPMPPPSRMLISACGSCLQRRCA